MRHLLNLALVGLVGLVVIVGIMWVFRGQVLRLFGVSFDTGAAAETALAHAGRIPRRRLRLWAGVAALHGRLAARACSSWRIPAPDRVIALPDRDGDGRADEPIVVGEGYDAAHSLAFEAGRVAPRGGQRHALPGHPGRGPA